MQHDSNLQMLQAEIVVSNAVLTPELIHPRYFSKRKSIPHIFRESSSKVAEKAMPLTAKEIEFRQAWENRQKIFIQHMPSTAVLGA